MLNQFVIDKTTESLIKEATILVDTNVMIDAWLFKAEFAELLSAFARVNCYLVATKTTLIEFVGSTNDETALGGKIQFLETLFGAKIDKIALPIDHSFPPGEDLLEFSRQSKHFSTTDFELYRTIKKYSHSGLLLMTRNHSDFTAPTFERKGFITLLGKKEIHTHGLYAYNR